MNALELALKCKNRDCNLCPYYDTECKDFMHKYELTPDTIISMLQWVFDGSCTTYLDLALECTMSPTCMQCKYRGKYECHSIGDYFPPCNSLTKLFNLVQEVTNDNS